MDSVSRRWLSRTVTLALDVRIEAFDEMMSQSPEVLPEDDLQNRNKSSTSAASQIDLFFTESDAGSVLFFYTTEKVAHRTVDEIKSIPPNTSLDVVQENEERSEDNHDERAGEEQFLTDENLEIKESNQSSSDHTPHNQEVTQSCHLSLNIVPPETERSPVIFFIKINSGKVCVNMVSDDLSNDTDKRHLDRYDYTNIEIACSNGDLLSSLEGVICHVFVPLLEPDLSEDSNFVSDKETTSSVPQNPSVVPEIGAPVKRDGFENEANTPTMGHQAFRVMDTMRHEFKSSLVKLSSQIITTRQQLRGESYLVIPDVKISDPEAHRSDHTLIAILEQSVEEWCKSIARIVEKESQRAPKQNGPLGEIEFWRERYANLSMVCEQTNVPRVQKMLKVLDLVESNALLTFKYHFSELTKLHIEAKDNVKFLTTLERHFKNLVKGSFAVMADTLPSMMNAIRMVWIISRHYNTDERVLPLMERIASEIARKVSASIDIHKILTENPVTTLQTIEQAKLVLELWFTTYMSVRERIETSGTDHRWEFDRKRLFEQTNYMAKVCDHLLGVVTVLIQFNEFLGPELKSVTGDSQGIEEIQSRVNKLISPFDTVSFRIFDRSHRMNWEAVMAQFQQQVEEIEDLTRRFIDTSFQKLRSAEGAFNLLQNFQNIQSRESINRQMMEKYQDILMQYTKELETLQNQFQQRKDDPPLYKHHPPVAGAIAWARSLYLRAKKTILRFREMNDLLRSPLGEEVKERYLVFARAIDAYIKSLHAEWQDKTPQAITEYLRQCILGPKLIETGKSDTGGTLFRLPDPPYYPNFASGLIIVIRESKYLDRLGFNIPESALNVTLQEEKYHHHIQELTLMLKHYDYLLSALTPVEKHLLRIQLEDLREVLRVGFSPLNWNSQRITSFTENCNRALNQFGNLVSQIHKTSKMVDDIVSTIRETLLIRLQDFEGVTTEVSDFYEIVERNRVKRIEELVQKYRSIGPLLIKVEELVAGVNTGTSPKMSAYYLYWERYIFNAITQMIIASMITLQALLNVHMKDIESSKFYQSQLLRQQQAKRIGSNAANNQSKGSDSSDAVTSAATVDSSANDSQSQGVLFTRIVRRAPVCKVKATMNGKDIVVTPSLSDMYKYLSKLVKHIVESAKAFVRWMHGTCRETEPLIGKEDDEPITFTFYSDISQNPYVLKLTLSLNQEIHKGFNIVNKYLDSWRRYDMVYNLWNTKRRSALDKLADKNPPCVYFDTRMAQYSRLAESVRQQPTEKDSEFLQLDCLPVAISIAKEAELWKDDYGRILYQLSSKKLRSCTQLIDTFKEELGENPLDLDSLKKLLHTIATILDRSMEMELEYCDIIECFRTLKAYEISVDDCERDQAMRLERRWNALILSAKTRDHSLVQVKMKFRAVTEKDAIQFKSDCKSLKDEIFACGPGIHANNLDAGLEVLQTFKAHLKSFQLRRQELSSAENLFALPITPYPELQEVVEEMEKQSEIYSLYSEAKEFISIMGSVLWVELDVPAMTRGVEELETKIRSLSSEYKIAATFTEMERQLLAFKESIPLIQSLKNDAMKPRHWEQLMAMTGVKFDMNVSTFTLANLFSMQLHQFGSKLAGIVNSSMQEQKVEQEINKIEEYWSRAILELTKYKKNGQDRGCYVLRGADELRLQLEDHMLNLQTISGSRFVSNFTDRVRKWEKRFNLVGECLKLWFLVQQKWMYLESIFVAAEDIRQQLPEEAKIFDAIDKVWKSIMATTFKNANALDACTSDNRLEDLRSLSDRLDNCQKSLSDFLDTKRNAFSRFYFISDDELLSVLGSSDPVSIQIHMLKLFDNVKQVIFHPSMKKVIAMESSEGESFSFRIPANVEGPVEVWMSDVEAQMKDTLHTIVKEGVFHYASYEKRTEWLDNVLGMVSLVGSQIWWTWEVEDVFHRARDGNKYAMKNLEAKLADQLKDLVQLLREPLSNNLRKKVNTLLITDVHAHDIVDSFVRNSILHEKEFAWESQLRFYWKKDINDVLISQCTGNFRFGYEYISLSGRLVITPLTDRCYMTLTQALTFKLGGSPCGPAGTGKTETVKDLAKSLALPCYVINCGEGLDYKAMGYSFSGLLQVGAWGCFDEFNRINIEVLSVVSAQMRAIQNALHYEKPTVDIGFGTEVRIHRTAGFATCGFFITMNPGYAGRTELPDNLKALFRPVTMVVPDSLMIAQIMLFSEGFENAVVLAKKMTLLYRLSQEQLSKQYHYDFGLRALKSVLVMAGNVKRKYPGMSEDLVLMRALRDSNMPKFVYDDVPLFKGLINDLLSESDCSRVGYDDFEEAIIKEMEDGGYRMQNERVFRDQIDKIIQLYETLLVRHTTMIVGPTGGGKSHILKTLIAASKTAFNMNIRVCVLNPKALPISELYGFMDTITRDWTDGILSKLFRELNQPLPAGKKNEKRWLVFDGDVDAVWVENMNSAMDDNKILTLPNGERIRLQEHCCMVCESFDLQYASPATISRCGMVWVDPKNLGYKPYFERWLRQRFNPKIQEASQPKQNAISPIASSSSPPESMLLLDLFDRYVPKCIEYVLDQGGQAVELGSKCRQVIPIGAMEMCKQLCTSFDTFLQSSPILSDAEEKTIALTSSPFYTNDLEGIFLFSIMWSIGSALVESSRSHFDRFLRKIAEGSMPPPTSSIYDYYYCIKSHKWQPWESQVASYVQPSPFDFGKIFVPTTDSVLYTFLLNSICRNSERPTLFVGDSGTAKTVITNRFLGGMDSQKAAILSLNFSSQTSSMDVQKNIQRNVDKRTGQIYGPAAGKKLFVFVDDLNMPKMDMYGTQQPIALLHYMMNQGAFYDRVKDLDLRILRDVIFLGAMGPPSGGRNPVDPRFVALFNVYNLNPPTTSVLKGIFGSIMTTFLKEFNPSVQETGPKLTDVLLKLFSVIPEKCLPTPAKFHYIFNLRDLGRVCEGLCLATPDVIEGPKEIVRLFRNEITRVFCDRLTNENDLLFVRTTLCTILKEHFSHEVVEHTLKDPLVFGDFAECTSCLKNADREDPRLYEDLGSYQRVRRIMEEVIEIHNMDHKPMTLVLFEMVLEHLCRLLRILKADFGHALLIGTGGYGKQSLSRLAAFTAQYDVFEIFLTRSYGETEFREDLKTLYRKLGTKKVVFLFTDAHAVNEVFIEYLNNMLTTGTVQALFDQEERDALTCTLRDEVKEAGMLDSAETLWKYYIDRCRKNLHIILAMSPSGNVLRTRCRNFPGLISGTIIDWFFPWPQTALFNVAEHFIQHEKLPDQFRESVTNHLVHAHMRVVSLASKFTEELRRHYYVTPKNYLDFIATYRAQLKEHHHTVNASILRLNGGLAKLVEASKAVDTMQVELSEKKVVVDEKTLACEELIQTIEEKSLVATKQQNVAKVAQAECEKASLIITKEKDDADAALLEALPAVEAAAAALQDLSKADLTEIKSFASPPALVMSVCMCVLILKPTGQELDLDWKGAKVMLSNPNLLMLLKEYEKSRISSKMISKMKTFLKNPDLNIENMKSISKAGSGLLVWLLAMVKYYDIAKNVEPLRNKVKTMEKEQAVKEQELEDLNETIKSLRQELENLSTQYQEANTELQGLKTQAEQMAKRLQAANKLLAGLASERVRWTKDVGSLQEQSGRLIGDCLLNASFLSYAGAFNFDYRAQLIYKELHSDLLERGIPKTDPFKLERSLTDDSTMQKWISEGLPADENSIENGILTTKASRFPLCIDPQQQAVCWIKKKEEYNNLTVKTLSDTDFMKHLELAIQFGNPFLFESVGEELDPILDPILDKNTFVGGSHLLIKLGDKNIEWDENFRLYFTSKLANPHYSPEIMGKTMIINYSVTQKGLTNQLLDVVVGHERPDLEEQYHHLVMEMSENTQLIVELEDTLLRELSSSTGNVLDNQELIDLLDETKNKATEIGSKLHLSSSTKDEITKARAVYTPVASRGSVMYFSMSALSSLMKMYEISLSSFLVVFNTSLNHAKRDTVMSKRLRHMIQSVTELTYEYTCTGIFERHKLIFAFQMTCMILQEAGNLERSELEFFLKGSILIDKMLPQQPDSLSWISSTGWKDLSFLSKSKKIFENIEIEIANSADIWKQWTESEAPEAITFPDGYSDRLTELQKLLLLRCFRQDRVYNAMKLFVSSVMGDNYVQPPVLDYERIYSQSSPISPIVCILSPGADPQADIQTLSEAHGFSGHRFRYLALGQGQGHLAEQMVETGYVRGHWVLLQNCHLLASWLKTLEKMLSGMHRPHKDFRLWLTTEPTDHFPLGILQRSLKVVTEPPDGLKQNMRSVYAKLDQSMLDECPHPAFPSLVYVLCFLHAVVLERRKYGKIGWNVNYDFNDSDFNISRKLLGLYLYKAQEDGDEQLPWGSLRYIIGDAMYGGRVSDEYDRRILTTYLSEYMGDFLFDDCQPFFFSRSGYDYRLPSSGSSIDAYIETVDHLPLTNSPAVFGLNSNAEIGYYTSMSKTVWKDLISLQPRSAENTSGQSREDRIAQVAMEIQSQLPQSFDVSAVRKQFTAPSPTQIVLIQELDRWNALNARMSTSLQDLSKALVGDIGMSDELDALGNELYDATIPKMWRMLSPDTEKPLASWFSHLLNRYNQYAEWIKDGELKVVWLSGLSVPESYLTALMQATCREKKWALDKTTLYTKVTSYVNKSEIQPSGSEIGCYLYGLILEGASWDRRRGCLAPQRPKQLVEELPLLQIIPIETHRLKLQNTFRAPVYITQARRNAMGVGSVFEADLHSTEHESHWILQGVALCLNTDF
uniref:Dynein-1, subspecies f n=1 Tax=Albugo laibachii Nc14 TaxID=890382 RepID=F0VZ46_9STRA|nr:PREDICTED: similar to hCG1811879 putative [Albugo laibachii Nc14]|eukprot:CCA14061.1 PREDICTED: similar to hCG1811879 putative [Albugo laibachii Nc14]